MERIAIDKNKWIEAQWDNNAL